jgi:hypothetical protein
MTLDRWDAMTILGLTLLGGALWAAVGWYALAAYLGAVLIIAGVVGARARVRRP